MPVGERDDESDVSTFMSELEEPTLTAAVKREIPSAETAADKRRSNEGQFAPIEEEKEGEQPLQGESEMKKQLKRAQ